MASAFFKPLVIALLLATSISAFGKTCDTTSVVKALVGGDKPNSIRAQLIDPNMTQGYFNLSDLPIHDPDAFYIGVANHSVEGSHHYYLISGGKRFDAYPTFTEARSKSIDPLSKLMPSGVFFKIKAPPEVIAKVEASIIKNGNNKFLTCLHGTCKVLEDADIVMGNRVKGGAVRVKTATQGLIDGRMTINGEPVNPEDIELIATSESELQHFLDSVEKTDAEEIKKYKKLMMIIPAAAGGAVGATMGIRVFLKWTITKLRQQVQPVPVHGVTFQSQFKELEPKPRTHSIER